LAGYPIVAIKGLQITNFNGKSLSSGYDSVVLIQPELKEADALKTWWESIVDKTAPIDSLTVRKSRENRMTILSVFDQHVGYGNDAEYVHLRVMITQMHFQNDRPPWYKACNHIVTSKDHKERHCGKKLNENSSDRGEFICPSHGNTRDYINKYMLRIQVADCTGSVWLTVFDDVAQKLLQDKSANELAELKDAGEDLTHLFQGPSLFQYWIISCRVKAEKEKFKDDAELKTNFQVIAAEIINRKKEIDLIKNISTSTNNHDNNHVSASSSSSAFA
jgi:replication factor A1